LYCIKLLKDDIRFIIYATGKAGRAEDYFLNVVQVGTYDPIEWQDLFYVFITLLLTFIFKSLHY